MTSRQGTGNAILSEQATNFGNEKKNTEKGLNATERPRVTRMLPNGSCNFNILKQFTRGGNYYLIHDL